MTASVSPRQQPGQDSRRSPDKSHASASARSRPRPTTLALVAWLVRTTRPVLRPLAASAACRVLAQLLGVGLFALAAWAVADAAQDLVAGRHPRLWQPLAAMVVLAAAKAALRYGEQYLGHLVAFQCLEILRAELFSALAPRAPRVMVTARSGDLLARATKDVDRVETFYAHTFAPAVSAVVVPAVVLVAVGAATSWPVACVAVAATVLAVAVVPTLGWGVSRESARRAVALRADLTQHVTDSVQGVREIVGYGRTGDRLEATAGLDDALARATLPLSLALSLRRLAVQLLVLLAPVAVLAVGAPDVVAGRVSLAALAAATAAVLRLGETVRGVEDLAGALSGALAAAERVHAVVTAEPELVDGEGELSHRAHELRWESVTYAYPGQSRPVVHDVSLTARAGRWTSLVGVSGSGKTTLARLALRFDDPQTGTVRVDGTALPQVSADSLRREVALVAQEAALLRGTVADNVRLAAPSATLAQVEQACRTACVHEDVEAVPGGYDAVVGERGGTVSGGQRQRLALARALVAEPSVLVLDEFTSHLDPDLDARVRANVREWARERDVTVVEVTHRLHQIGLADHVVVLDGGRVVQSGAPQQLLDEEGGPLARLVAREAS
ncbi:ABC transporter ATP-binding protein [Actinomyces faecalis]|uniref:ABC transporter ATP-binding protein n=1 Tax=Actinomyces faecalis TaxID=2722820 RepID=UPI002E2E7968|nr:ABC transporter ATP-binding protein [Actinomyces faecalis]